MNWPHKHVFDANSVFYRHCMIMIHPNISNNIFNSIQLCNKYAKYIIHSITQLKKNNDN